MRLKELAISAREVDLAVLPASLLRLAIRCDVVHSLDGLATLTRLITLDLMVGHDERENSKAGAVR